MITQAISWSFGLFEPNMTDLRGGNGRSACLTPPILPPPKKVHHGDTPPEAVDGLKGVGKRDTHPVFSVAMEPHSPVRANLTTPFPLARSVHSALPARREITDERSWGEWVKKLS